MNNDANILKSFNLDVNDKNVQIQGKKTTSTTKKTTTYHELKEIHKNQGLNGLENRKEWTLLNSEHIAKITKSKSGTTTKVFKHQTHQCCIVDYGETYHKEGHKFRYQVLIPNVFFDTYYCNVLANTKLNK